MNSANLLLLSSSRVKATEYLAHALPMIEAKLNGVKDVLFIPYAGVTINYDDYTDRVKTALASLNVNVVGIHQCDDPVAAIASAQAIMVGGGNTFHLLHQLYENKLIEPIQTAVAKGTCYIGWSAGSNIAGKSIRTTNDMPIIEPESFTALNLVNFQLNPHYTDYNPPGHNGETRAQRLAEFMVVEPSTPIVAIVEGTALSLQDSSLSLIGGHEGYIFKAGEKTTIAVSERLDYLLQDSPQ